MLTVMVISPSPCNRRVRLGCSPRDRSSIVRMCARSGRRSGCYGCTGSSEDVWSLFLTWREFLRGPLHKDYDFRHCLWKVSESWIFSYSIYIYISLSLCPRASSMYMYLHALIFMIVQTNNFCCEK